MVPAGHIVERLLGLHQNSFSIQLLLTIKFLLFQYLQLIIFYYCLQPFSDFDTFNNQFCQQNIMLVVCYLARGTALTPLVALVPLLA